MLLGQALPADLEDGVRVQSVEGPEADHGVVPFPAERPVVGAVRQRALDPGGMPLDRGIGIRCGGLQATSFGWRQVLSRGHDLADQDGQARGRLDGRLLPSAHLRPGRPGFRLLEEGRRRLQPSGDRAKALGQGRVIPREQEEETVADRVEALRPSGPGPDLVGPEDGQAQVVDLEVAFEPGRLGQAGRVHGLDRREMGPLIGELLFDGVAGPVAELVVVLVHAQVGGRRRVRREQAPESRFDQVEEGIVQGAAVRRGRGAWEVDRRSVGQGEGSSGRRPAADAFA